ncbi:MAG: DUF3093 domain-containing protein [Leucobacter sp.]
MTGSASPDVSVRSYRERLVPGVGLFIAVLLVIPAVTLVLTPVNAALALPTGIVLYLIVAAVLLLLSPTIELADGMLVAGRARIPTRQLGRIEMLGAEGLRAAIGPGLDARSYLLVRGWIHRGLRIENVDPADPAPVWILTTRHPQRLAEAIEAARGAAG